MQVRLLRKFAQFIDGVDLTHHAVGEVFEMQAPQANLLIAEGWAEVYAGDRVAGSSRLLAGSRVIPKAEIADHPTRAVWTLDRIQQVQRRLAKRRLSQPEGRRVEDRIREELRDSRARTVLKHEGDL